MTMGRPEKRVLAFWQPLQTAKSRDDFDHRETPPESFGAPRPMKRRCVACLSRLPSVGLALVTGIRFVGWFAILPYGGF